ncbi:MAG: hypothetical protein P1V97_31915 [Planctomycetota bacterium]|nr:hypothetical protein [Planctomycetota bacterium]
MDQEFNEIERAFELNPEDKASLERYTAALRREPTKQPIQEYYRFKFRCPLQWSDFTPTDNHYVRHCQECARDVHFVTNLFDFQKHALANHCVAVVDMPAFQEGAELLNQPELDALRPQPCIVETDPRTIYQAAPPDPNPSFAPTRAITIAGQPELQLFDRPKEFLRNAMYRKAEALYGLKKGTVEGPELLETMFANTPYFRGVEDSEIDQPPEGDNDALP